jgi:hypothetical protein
MYEANKPIIHANIFYHRMMIRNYETNIDWGNSEIGCLYWIFQTKMTQVQNSETSGYIFMSLELYSY